MVDEKSTNEAPVAVAAAANADEARIRVLPLVAAVVLALLLVVAAALIVGDRPRAADAGYPDQPPPLAIPSDVPEDSLLARSAAQLAAGNLGAARRGFTDVVAADQDGVAGQVGLVLSRWRSTGPESVERDLRQLTLEYPESALALLHLGLVQALLDEPRAARESLRSALTVGREQSDPTSLRMALLADDLLHPGSFRGTMPVLVGSAELPPAQRPALRALAAAVARGDRRAVTKEARSLEASGVALAAVAVAAARFDKTDPDVAVAKLKQLAERETDVAARDRARMLAALADVWGGGDRTKGCNALRRSTVASVDAGTRRLAVPIVRELCTAPHSAG